MKISLHEKMQEYVNSKGISILNKIYDVAELASDKKQDLKSEPSYLRHKPIVDLSGKAKFDSESTIDQFNNRILTKYKLLEDKKIGFEKDGIDEILNLIRQIIKDTKIADTIAENFLFEEIFEWAILYYQKKETRLLSVFILEACNKTIQSFAIYIPILYLETNAEFDIGRTRFCYLTDVYINELSKKIEEDKREFYIKSLQKFKGQLFGKCYITAQKEKATEIAKKQIVEAIDVLRLLSPTVEVPDYKIFYDVDFLNLHQIQSTTLSQPVEDEHFLSVSHSRIPIPFIINQTAWDAMTKLQLKKFHVFLQKELPKTELEKLILKAIRNFSKAIANHNLHERVIQVFTVLESLLLPNENAPILDSISKYLPKLVSDKTEERRMTVDVIKEMYEIRSSMVHHAIEKELNIDSLSKLCIVCRILITQFLYLTQTKKNKQEILKDIDDRLMNA